MAAIWLSINDVMRELTVSPRETDMLFLQVLGRYCILRPVKTVPFPEVAIANPLIRIAQDPDEN